MRAIGRTLTTLAVIMIAANASATEATNVPRRTNEQIITEGNNKFALELYARLRVGKGNLFLSPYSISTALGMAYAGARSETESQMAEVLHFPTAVSEQVKPPADPASGRQRFALEFGKIIKDLNHRGRAGGYELEVANALWGQKRYRFLDEFLETVKTNYDGQFSEVDFVKAAEDARKTINTWVEKETNNKIKDLISKGVLNSMTRLVLTNAIYFKGNWARQFKEERTRDAPFTLADGRKIDVAMMNQTAEFGYIQADTFQGLELPYADDELSMIVLLPIKYDGLSELEKTLTLDNLSQWLAKLHKRKVVVSIPRFKMTSQFSLASVLKSLGMKNAFSAGADFSGMNGQRNLFISAVIHKAYVDVNEEGTEAAAATGVTMTLTSIGPARTPVFRADHPFLFLIRDNNSGSILFFGRLMNPDA